jgi:hypothetical protein
LESLINKKKRINDRNSLRNGLDYIVPGEKAYRNPECSTDFYKTGGLIPGSTMREIEIKTVNRKYCNSFDTLNLTMSTLNREKLWFNKVKNDIINNDAFYVKTLTQWDKEFFKKNNPIAKQVLPNTKQTNKKIK